MKWITVILALLLILVLFLFYRSCNKIDVLQNDVNAGKKKSDSIANLAKITFHENDSISAKINTDSVRYSKKIDSLETIFKRISSNFEKTKSSLSELAVKYKIAINNLDSGIAITICDSIIEDLAMAQTQLQQVETNRDSLIAYHEQTIKGLYEDISVLQKEIEELKSDLLTEMELLKNCQNDFAKLNRGKKANAIIAKVEFVLLVALGIFTSLKK